ncbi:hypothetical protein HNV10_15175 [Winogradskyella litoriviva]|uniref:Amino acid permease n=1 Tax=Winogradskyella litoriviva TaxID=1220182 RepID=A0ABX2E8K2_9FLAO|nr:hypothetical protein [Winogradskyella litoriviva]NRD24595.1 hypothetical protein [Winogradskyella litoriviva]
MVALLVIAFLLGGGITFFFLRFSISCMFWFSKYPNDKPYVFQTKFPYYIISLFSISITLVIASDMAYFAMYYFITVHFLSLLIWYYKLHHCKKKYSTVSNTIEQSQPKLP